MTKLGSKVSAALLISFLIGTVLIGPRTDKQFKPLTADIPKRIEISFNKILKFRKPKDEK